MTATRPLHGIRVVDLSTLGPGPFATMVLAGHGADVIQVKRPGPSDHPTPYFDHAKRIIGVDLKSDRGRELVRDLISTADVVLEGYRPGAMERLGLGPEELCAANPRLIYVRLTGWGQSGPYAHNAGHDVNYIAIAGALSAIGAGSPTPPLAIIGDFAGGGLFAVIGVLLALQQRQQTGRGQVVDAAIVDGVTTLLWATLARSMNGTHGQPGTNLTDGGRPYYRTYRCADGRFFALGAIEPKFYAAALQVLGLHDEDPADQNNPTRWPAIEATIADAFRAQPRDEWTNRFADSAGCGTPVLDLAETVQDPHLRARDSIVQTGNAPHLRPAPRLSESPAALPEELELAELFREMNLSESDIVELVTSGVLEAPNHNTI